MKLWVGTLLALFSLFGQFVVKCINNLKNNKASGPDQIPNEILKMHKLDILLYKYFRLCFKNAISLFKGYNNTNT